MKHTVFALALFFSAATWAQNYEVIADKSWLTAPDVVSFQPFLTKAGPTATTDGGQVALVNLNHFINRWYLLTVTPPKGKYVVFNIENPYPETQSLTLNSLGEVVLKIGSQAQPSCTLVSTGGEHRELDFALAQHDPYVSLCEGRLQLRNRANGRSDKITWSTFDPTAQFTTSTTLSQPLASDAAPVTPPPDAKVSKVSTLTGTGNGFQIDNDGSKGMIAGHWYKATNFNGVYISAMRAGLSAAEILKVYPSQGEEIVNLMALDLDQFRFGWTNGTEHPGVGWSSRAGRATGPGPDGFGNLSPLTFPAVVNPVQAPQTVGVFTGGFQRHHSAFRAGPLHEINRGSHYGFMEKGVLMSTLVPNLASLIINANGTIDLKTWTLADNQRLPTISDVRQNGVPLIETDPSTQKGYGNPLALSQGGGNWSGNASGNVRTPRTAACLVENEGKRYLLMTYFNQHTPAGMVPVLMAYGCKYAIHLDMNSPVFSYSAFFTPRADGSFTIEHLSTSMASDTIVNGKSAPRWVMTPTYRDFFYVMKK